MNPDAEPYCNCIVADNGTVSQHSIYPCPLHTPSTITVTYTKGESFDRR